MYCILPNRAFLRISGDDAVPFLQGLVSNDVTKLAQQGILYAALLSPQGKFLHDFFLIAHDGAILIDCEKSRRDDLVKRLSLYKLRSKVIIEPVAMTVAAIWDEEIKTSGDIFQDPRLPPLGYRIIGETIQREYPAPFDAYEKLRLSLGVPDGSRDMIPDKTLLLECGFEALHGVDFNKGCYVGQEVTARSKFRAQLRKSLYKITGDAPLPPSGTEITAAGTPIGECRSASGTIGLAILRMEEVEKFPGDLRTGGVAIKASLPDWMARH